MKMSKHQILGLLSLMAIEFNSTLNKKSTNTAFDDFEPFESKKDSESKKIAFNFQEQELLVLAGLSGKEKKKYVKQLKEKYKGQV